MPAARLTTLLALLLAGQATPAPRIAIIIDDIGWHYALGRRAIELPGPIACAVLPHTPRAAALARLATDSGKDVLLHLPLEPVDRTADAPDAGRITLDMTRGQLAAAVAGNLAAVPRAIGVNSHRGSLLTRHPGHMSWLMAELRSRGLFFVDSYTTHRSVALAMAREAGIPAARRDVFLDSDPSAHRVAAEFERLKALARERGSAIAIGHPYPGTLTFLERALPGLAEEGIELVGITEILGAQAAVRAGGDPPLPETAPAASPP